jgi:hypothetical protein
MQREPGLAVKQENFFDLCAMNWVPVESESSTAARKFRVGLEDGLLCAGAGFLSSNAGTADDRLSWILLGDLVSACVIGADFNSPAELARGRLGYVKGHGKERALCSEEGERL